jgi:hypothetical protein
MLDVAGLPFCAFRLRESGCGLLMTSARER